MIFCNITGSYTIKLTLWNVDGSTNLPSLPVPSAAVLSKRITSTSANVVQPLSFSFGPGVLSLLTTHTYAFVVYRKGLC